MSRIGTLLLALGVLVPTLASAVAPNRDYRLHPRDVSQLPTFVQRVQQAIVGLRVRVDEDKSIGGHPRHPALRERGDLRPARVRLTVSYVLLDAVSIEARTRDDRVVNGQLVGIDFDTGLGVVKLDGEESWPVAPLGQSRDVIQGALTGTVGVDEEGTLVWVSGAVQGIRRFSAYWEYMLDRAFMVAPGALPGAGAPWSTRAAKSWGSRRYGWVRRPM